MKELEKNYNPNIEDKIYSNWLEKKYFAGTYDESKESYTIVIPPPNITGVLHMGHALNNTIQDILIRTKRMQGYNTLWIPGTDHASISTETKIVDKITKEGFTKEVLGREKFLEEAWDWKNKYGTTIIEQLKKIGCSCDFDRQRFTLDEGLNRAVHKVFVKLYNDGLIYKGEKLINWCPHCETTISDAEVDHEDTNGGFWHLTYKVKDTDEIIEFATTRPETLLGDTAIAVNPNDERYAHLVGKTAIIPIINREIPIIADEYVEVDFGTGVVKITPAHDPNDYEVGKRHNLPLINVMNDDGTMNKNAGKYEGLNRFDARKEIIKDFDALGQFVKKKDIVHAVGKHERCKNIVEPLIKEQWFVKMDSMAKKALDVYYNGELRFIPDRFGKIYKNWLENIQDWCISRQLWWGHRIPAYYCECGHITVSENTPEKCEKCGNSNITQDEDTLDTWFSSALWPFSTLGWPEDTDDLKHFYPTSVIVTSYDIIFFWVVRMVFSGLEYTGKLPFKDVYINGLMRDENGLKMSKSLGNGIDPLEIINEYGTDVLRLTLITGNSAGNDLKFSMKRIESNRTFLNKLWNATRFVLMNIDDVNDVKFEKEKLTTVDKWILSSANNLVKDVTNNIENYDLGIAVQKIHDFIWEQYCDWYIEMVKPRLYDEENETREVALYTLLEVLKISLKLLHPFMPFITEEIFTTIQNEEETIMLSNWPTFNEAMSFTEEEKEIELIKTAIKNIRATRSEMNVPPSRKAKMYVVTIDENVKKSFENSELFIKTLGSASEVIIQNDKTDIADDFVSVVIPNAVIYIPFADLVDIQKEIERLTKEKAKLEGEVDRVVKKLSNEGFVSKAPEKLINAEKEKQEKYQSMLDEIVKQLKVLTK